MPFIITAEGCSRSPFPVVFEPHGHAPTDGGVHALFTITGRSGRYRLFSMAQPNFEQMQQLNNLIFRIPTPLYGAGHSGEHRR